MSCRSKYLIGAVFIFVIGLLVFCFAIYSLANGHLKRNWFIASIFLLTAVYTLSASGRALWSARKSPKFESVFLISSPNFVSIVAPRELHGGKIVIHLARGSKFYRGEILVILKHNDSQLELGKASLSGAKPAFRIPVPIWFKWFKIQEAGTTLDFWPRSASRSFDPVIVPFTQTVAQGDIIEFRIDVESIICLKVDGNNGKKCKSDVITVCFSN